MNTRTFIYRAVACTLAAGAACMQGASSAFAQAYPAKPVRFVSPFAPGGPTDLLSRPVGVRMHESLGQPFVIDYRAGASGAIGADHVAKSPPDGYTLLVMTGSFTTAPATSRLPYDTLKDFTGIGALARGHSVIVVNPRLPVRGLKEFVALAKAQPGKLNYATSGAGGLVHLGMEMFKLAAGINLVHVPYKGVIPALQDVMGGYIEVMFIGAAPAMAHLKSGKVRALAVASARRSPAFPDTPTIAESGYPGFELVSVYGIVAPAATPPAIVRLLNSTLEKALAHPDTQKAYTAFGVDVWADTPERFTQWLAEDVARWLKLAKSINYQPAF